MSSTINKTGPKSQARVPYVDPDSSDPKIRDIFDTIDQVTGRRLNLHLTMANAPNLCRPFIDFALAIRAKGCTEWADRELAILRTAHLNDGEYELVQHRPMAERAGLSPQQINAVAEYKCHEPLFDSRQLALLGYIDGMCSHENVTEATFDRLKRYYTSSEIVELTLTVSFYASVCMASRALAIPIEAMALGG